MALTPSTMLPLGTKAPDFSLPGLDGTLVKLADMAEAPALLVIFMCNHCPFVKHVAAGLASLAKEYQARKVAVVGINSNDAAKYPDDAPAKMKEEAKLRGYTFPYLFDESQAAAKAYRAACTPDFLTRAGVGQLAALKSMFVLYALLGLFGGLIYARIPARRRHPKVPVAATLGPSRFGAYKLAAVFCLDAFAGGLVVQSLLALWLFERFDMSLTAASLFFSWSGILSAFSFLVATQLSRRIGLMNTTVLTHLSSSILLILAAITPTLSMAMLLLLLRAALSQMDAPIRSAYVTAVVAEYERPAAAAITSVSSRVAASAGPASARVQASTALIVRSENGPGGIQASARPGPDRSGGSSSPIARW